MGKRIFFFSLILCLLFTTSACSDDDSDNIQNEIVGTWRLTSVKIDGVDKDISLYPGLIQFQENTIFQSYNEVKALKSRGGWNYESDMLTISLYLPAAYYVLNIDAQNMSLKRLDFNTDGSIRTTIEDYRRTADSDLL